MFVTSACLQIPTVTGLSGGETSGGTRSTTATGGSASGGNVGATGGACLVGETSQQLDSCADAGGCGCPLACASDPLAKPIDSQGRVCEAGCQSDAECNILTACVGGICTLIACGADAGNGTYAFACAMGDESGRGSCDVGETDAGRFSLCVAGGTSDGGCDTATANREEADGGLCLPGYFCFGPSGGTKGTCAQLCDDVTTFCPGVQKCNQKFSAPPNWGHCQ